MATIAGASPPAAPRPAFAARHRRDGIAIALLLLYVWIGILSGFGTGIARRLADGGPPLPAIVHVHAAAFTAWLLLFTVQAGLIRFRRPQIHRRLGWAMMPLAAFIPVIGTATALHTDRLKLGTPAADPAFLYVQLSDMVAFTVLTAAALLLRARPAAHKRLILLSLLYISDAGFARFFGTLIVPMIPSPALGIFLGLYGLNGLGMVAIGAYDRATRGRFHPAWLAGYVFILLLQLATLAAYLSPAARPLALAILAA